MGVIHGEASANEARDIRNMAKGWKKYYTTFGLRL